MERKTVFALARIGAALLAAVILLACTGWAFVELISAPQTVTQGAELSDGAYVTADLRFVMDICGVERDVRSGEPVAYLAIAPVGDQFVIVRFPAKDYDAYAALEAETQGYLRGTQRSLSYHMSATGTAKTMDEDTAQLLADWFNENAEWMSRSGLIAAVENYSTYLCVYQIDTGAVGSVSTGTAVTLSLIAAALIAYAVVEAFVLAVRVSRPKPEKKYKGVYDG